MKDYCAVWTRTLKTLYNLTDNDAKVFNTLCNECEATVESIAELLHKDRSVVQKSIKKLMDHGLVVRDSIVCEKGRYYVYRLPSQTKLRKQVLSRLRTFNQEVKNVLDILNRNT
ncbi:hypothetical protein DRN75_03525 [Nanoarchaeota archaeon]|nr:MAG: hypothetical protein DRN75_03525 [Nanoarchaeota archaeon]